MKLNFYLVHYIVGGGQNLVFCIVYEIFWGIFCLLKVAEFLFWIFIIISFHINFFVFIKENVKWRILDYYIYAAQNKCYLAVSVTSTVLSIKQLLSIWFVIESYSFNSDSRFVCYLCQIHSQIQNPTIDIRRKIY